MRPRTEIVAGLAILSALLILASALGRAKRPPYLGDLRASTYLTGPDGARGLADALERLDVEVYRFRRRTRELALLPPPDREGPHAFVLLAPGIPLEATEIRLLIAWQTRDVGGDLVLVGDATEPVMECFGWSLAAPLPRARPVAPPGEAPGPGAASLVRFLEPLHEDEEEDDDQDTRARNLCDLVPVARTDTLLVSEDGRPAIVRLLRADVDRTVVLAGDADLFRNATLRQTDTGPLVLGLLAEGYRRVTFDEARHGFGPSGSLASAVFAWSLRSPWGWALWQAAVVGLLVLLTQAVRFGPVRSGIERRRRSPLEHVRALATALTSARGHDVAIRAIVRGLRRRLTPAGGRSLAGDPGPWLTEVAAHAPGTGARAAARSLHALTTPGQPAAAVLRAAHLAEDLWQELHP